MQIPCEEEVFWEMNDKKSLFLHLYCFLDQSRVSKFFIFIFYITKQLCKPS